MPQLKHYSTYNVIMMYFNVKLAVTCAKVNLTLPGRAVFTPIREYVVAPCAFGLAIWPCALRLELFGWALMGAAHYGVIQE